MFPIRATNRAILPVLWRTPHQHRKHGLAAPTKDPAVRAVLKSLRRNAAPRREPLPSPALLGRMIGACPGDLAGLRDRALLLLLAATGLRRAALVSLDAEAIQKSGVGFQLRLGPDGALQDIQLSRNPDGARCPVHALEAWLDVSQTSFGPVFRKIDRWGNIEHHRLGTDAVRRILARRTPHRRRHIAAGGIAPDPADPA
jgi:integrase